MPPLIQVANISAVYGKNRALFDASITLNQGEISALIGPNGAGKSTLLKAIAGLVPVTEGSVEYLGKNITNRNTRLNLLDGLGYCPEGGQGFTVLTVLENLNLAAYLVKGKKEIATRIDAVFDLFPSLFEKKSYKVGFLSGGERHMLAIGMGLMLRPKALLLDEPLVGLAPILVDKVCVNIERMKKEMGVSMILVEQNVGFALSLANQVYVLKSGVTVYSAETKNCSLETLTEVLYQETAKIANFQIKA